MNTQKSQMFDRDGNPINATVLPDGGRLRVSVSLMDSAPPDIAAITRNALAATPDLSRHRPGTLVIDGFRGQLAAIEREALRNHRLNSLSDAWRNPPALATDAKSAAVADAATTADARYEARCAALERAWQGA